ncbi:hypothetical protein ACFLTU_01135 [Bacteroidota bacterium]
MKFRDLQRFFSGEFTEMEKIHLFRLTQNSKGKEILAMAIEEGWNESSDRKRNIWDSDSCFNKILGKITSHNY